MEARDGSLESVSKTLSIRPHLFLECTVPLSRAFHYVTDLYLVICYFSPGHKASGGDYSTHHGAFTPDP